MGKEAETLKGGSSDFSDRVARAVTPCFSPALVIRPCATGADRFTRDLADGTSGEPARPKTFSRRGRPNRYLLNCIAMGPRPTTCVLRKHLARKSRLASTERTDGGPGPLRSSRQR